MKNDAKLGMLAGVLGVIVAAVLFANAPPPPPVPANSVTPEARPPPTAQPGLAETASTSPVAPETSDALPSTPVARTRKDVDAQPTGRGGGMEEP
jgi:hypothetical protein